MASGKPLLSKGAPDGVPGRIFIDFGVILGTLKCHKFTKNASLFSMVFRTSFLKHLGAQRLPKWRQNDVQNDTKHKRLKHKKTIVKTMVFT